MTKMSRRPPKLPVQQLVILGKSALLVPLLVTIADMLVAICRFAEPIAATSVFPYLV